MMPQNQFLLNNNISCDVDQLRTYCCCWFRPRLVSPKTLQEINQLQLEPRILFPQALWNPSGCWAIGIPSILWTKGILDLIGYLNWLQDQLGFRMGFNPCDNSVGTSLYGQWGTTQVYLFVNRSQCIAVLLHPKKTSPRAYQPIISWEIPSWNPGNRIPPPFDPTCLWPGGTKQQGLPFSGALLDCGSRNPGFWAVQQTTCFFSFSGAIFNQAFKAI